MLLQGHSISCVLCIFRCAAKRINSDAGELAQIRSVLTSFTFLILGQEPVGECTSAGFLPGPHASKDKDSGKDEEGSMEVADGTKDASDGKATPATEVKGDDDEDNKDEGAVVESESMEVDASDAQDASGNGDSGDAATSPAPKPTCFYANRHWFVYFRLHQIVYERFRDIKTLSDAIAGRAEAADEKAQTPAVSLSLRTPFDCPSNKYYQKFVDLTESLVSGGLDASSYEENMREMFNIAAYKTFTMERLLSTTARKVEQFIKDDTTRSVAGLFLRHREGALDGQWKCTMLGWMIHVRTHE